MKKIPTLFERVFTDHQVTDILPNITPGFEWVLNGEGIATVKYDGSCCAKINGVFYKRYDAKHGKEPPKGAIACCDPDPITGHWPHWVKVNPYDRADMWFNVALTNSELYNWALLPDGTYEAIGKHFNGNPYGYDTDMLVKHGEHIVEVERSFEGIREYLRNNYIEGLVFWKDGQPQCKIKRKDFGFEWGRKQ